MAQTGTVIPDAMAEDILELYTGVDLWVSLHTAEPGKTGAGESATLARQKIATSGGWGTVGADSGSGGRKVANAAQLDYGEASAAETIGFFGFWSASTSGTFLGGAPVTTPQTTVIGNPVFVPVGGIVVIAAGS